MYKFNDKIHLHTYGDKPLTGTSTVMSVLAKPLTWWASGKAVEVLGWLNPKFTPPVERQNRAGEVLQQIKGMDTTAYIKLLDKAYSNHNTSLKEAASGGTDMHARS